MQRKAFFGWWLVSSLVLLLLLLSGGVANAGPPPPLEQHSLPLQPAAGRSNHAISDEIGAMALATLYPSADAPVREGAPNSTTPDQLYLGAGYDNGFLYGSTGRVRSYLRFDLSSLSGTAITSAKLCVSQVAGQDYPNTARTVTFYRVTANWSESGITWNNRPGYAEAVASVSTSYDFQDWLEMDLTDLVRAWVSGEQANYGLVAVGPESIVGVLRAFGSSESTHSPELQVSYEAVPPPVLDVSPGTLFVRTDRTEQLLLHISNVTANSLDWTAAKVGSVGWLSLDPSGGSVTPTSPDTLRLTANPAGQPPGIYTAQVRVSSSTSGVQGSPKTVDVTLELVEDLERVYLPLVLKDGAADSAPQVVALAIGISDYLYLAPQPEGGDLPDDPSSGDLYAPKFDLADTVTYLRTEGQVPASNIIQRGESAATKANVLASFAELDRREDEKTIVIIYYTGHGGQVPDDNADESDGYDEFIAMYEVRAVPGGYEGILTDDELQALLAQLESKHIIVILDSCYSGGMMDVAAIQAGGDLRRRGLGRPGGSPAGSVQEEQIPMAELVGPGRVIITGGTGDQPTWESYSLQNGVFTYFFLQGLRDAFNDANQNGRVSVEEAYWFSREAVDDWVYSYEGEHQNPDINDEHFGQVDLTWLP